MEDVQGNLNALPPFLVKTYEMVDDQATDSIVSWSHSNKSFIVWDQPIFARDLLPKYFKHNNFSSFIRQLNTYGFRKIDPEQWEFANEEFIRGQPHLLKNIHRRKPVHSHSMQNLHGQGNLTPLSESEKRRYEEQINRLRREKESFLAELQRQAIEKQQIESEFQLLRDLLQQMEQTQNQIYSNLSQELHKPELLLNQSVRKRRLSSCETGGEVSLTRRGSPESSVLGFDMDLFDHLESSLCIWENIVSAVEEVIVHGHTPMDLAESTCPESPTISYTQLNVDVPTTDSSTIDMNCEPSSPISASTPPAGTVISVAQGVNDVFWEQFLTENPGSSEAQNGEERKNEGENGKEKENGTTEYGKYWWNKTSGKSFQEHIGQLTAGRS
ncbi:hypothetical protein V2J09_006537 [Rumex salicifolius]